MKKFGLIAIFITLVASGFVAPRVFGMPDESVIATTCTTAQSVLNQIQKADIGSRINRGHDYNEILDLMFAMNARLSVNKIAAPSLTDLALQFEQNLAKFRTNYDSYDDTLTNTLKIKCVDNPMGFYDKLETTRATRELLRQDITTLSGNIDDYYAEFNAIVKEAGL